MAKKKGLRRKLLGSTKTGRLVRAASLAGVLGGGGYLASRSRASSSTSTAPRSASTPALMPSPTPSSSSRPLGSSGAKNPRKHSNKVTTVRGLTKRIDRLRAEKRDLSPLASKDARRGIHRDIKGQIAAAKIRVKQIPKESASLSLLRRTKTNRIAPEGWVSPVKGTRRNRRKA